MIKLNEEKFIFRACSIVNKFIATNDTEEQKKCCYAFDIMCDCIDENEKQHFIYLRDYMLDYVKSKNNDDIDIDFDFIFWITAHLNTIRGIYYKREDLELIEEAIDDIETISCIEDIKYFYGNIIHDVCECNEGIKVTFIDGFTKIY